MRAPPDGGSGPSAGAGLGLAVLLALGVTLAMAGPVVRAPSTRLFGTEIVGRHHDPFTVMAHFRHPPPLGWWTQPATDIPGRLLARVSGPVAAHNWLVLASFPLSAGAAYLLARHVTGSHLASTIAGLAYAFSPFHLAHAAYHVHIAQTQWLPLYLLALWRCVARPGPAAAGLLVASAAALALASVYLGFIGAVLTPVALVSAWLVAPAGDTRRPRGLVVPVLALGFLGVAVLAYARVMATAPPGAAAAPAFPRADLARYSAGWWSYLVPPVEHPLLGAWALDVWARHGVRGALLEHQVALGWALLLLAGLAVWRWLAGDRTSPGLRWVPVLAALAAAALLCSLAPEGRIGPVTLVRPSGLLHALAPGIRAYARFGVAVQLAVALLAGVGAAWLRARRTPLRAATLAALLAVAAIEQLPAPPWRWRDVLPTRAHRWLAAEPGPLRVLDCVSPVRRPAEQSVTWLLGHEVALLGGPFADCDEPELAGKLAAMGYTHLLVRDDRPSPSPAASPAPGGLRLVRAFPGARVFRVVADAPLVYTSGFHGFLPREPDGARTRRWMAGAGTWTVSSTAPGPVRATLAVDLTPHPDARRVSVTPEGGATASVVLPAGRHRCRLGPVTLLPGANDLTFAAAGPPSSRSGSARPVSLAVGEWRWTAATEPPGGLPPPALTLACVPAEP